MGSGPGRVQRGILDAVTDRPPLHDNGKLNAVPLPDLAAGIFPDVQHPGRAQIEAVRRAAFTLANSGQVGIWYVSSERDRRTVIAVTRPLTGDEQQRRDARREEHDRLYGWS